jgi:hypothetical protein
VSDEIAIALFEDVERERDARTEDGVEWEQRELDGDSIEWQPEAWEPPKSMGIENAAGLAGGEVPKRRGWV